MYFRLKEPWAFRGWSELPFAIRAERGDKKFDKPYFFKKEPFMDLLFCNGEEDVNQTSLSEEGWQHIRKLIELDIVEESPDPLPPLARWQRYRIFPARYISWVHWSITGKCNFNCRHCLVSAPDAHLPQLPIENILHIADEIARAGIRRADITGGEPLLRQDFERIVEALSAADVAIGVVYTNASLLRDETLDMFERHGQHPAFQLSFDGLGHHDWLRGVPGAEAQADAAFRLLRKRGYRANAAMCIHRENRDSLRDTANYLAGLGVDNLKVNSPAVMGEWRDYSDEFALTDGELWETYRDFIPNWFADGMPIGIELDGYFHCRKDDTNYRIGYAHHCTSDTDWTKIPYCEATRYMMHIGPDGRAYACMAFSDSVQKDSMPSLLEQPLSEISLASAYRDVVDTKVADLLAKNPECASCEHLPACCGGCMAQDMTDDGDYLVPESRCCYFYKHVGEQAVRDIADAAIAKLG